MKTPTGEHTYTVGAIIIDYTSDQGSVIMDREIFVKQFKNDYAQPLARALLGEACRGGRALTYEVRAALKNLISTPE